MQENRETLIKLGYQAVCLAFGIIEGEGGGAGPFSGNRHRSANSSKRQQRRTRDGEIVYSDATRVSATETRNSGTSRPLLHGDQPLARYIHQCIAELNEREQLWVRLCYGDRCKRRGESWVSFLQKYSRTYQEAHCKNAKVGTRSVIREMIAWRMRQGAGEIPFTAQFKPASKTLTRQQWHNTYKEHWKTICGDLERVDRAALYKIGVKVNLQ